MNSPQKLLLTFFVSLFCLQSSIATAQGRHNPESVEPAASEKSLIESSNRFSFKLFRQITADEKTDSNIFTSPLSVSYALTMTLNGGAGETRRQIAAALELSDYSLNEVNKSFRRLTAGMTALDPAVKLDIANSIWYRLGLRVRPEFVDLNKAYFNALVQELDFDAAWAADTINNWVNVNTKGKIKEIIRPPIDPAMVMYLINAIYFKGDWSKPFDSALTRTHPFSLPNKSETDCRMMFKKAKFNYLENDLFQAAGLPYGEGKFDMIIFLPRPSITVDDLIGKINDENWTSWVSDLSETKINLGLPKFKIEYGLTMNDALKTLGMESPFSRKADFTNMIPEGGVWIDRVKHKTFIQVDEEGTEAAAVTVVSIMKASAPQPVPQMIIDRPFLFVIREQGSGAVLFMGRITNPKWNN
jgi:serine protease inhibitor